MVLRTITLSDSEVALILALLRHEAETNTQHRSVSAERLYRKMDTM